MTQNEKEKLSYCLGANIGMSLQSQGLEDLDVKNFTEALNDVLSEAELKINAEEINNYLQAYLEKFSKNNKIKP